MTQITKINGIPIANTSVSGLTYDNNTLTIGNTNGTEYSTDINTMTGLTVTGGLTGTSFVKTGAPENTLMGTDGASVSGGTNISIIGNIISVSGVTGGGGTFTGGTVSGATEFTNGLTANTITASNYIGLPLDVFVTGGTYSNGSTVFTNNNGDSFSVNGYKTNDVFVTGGTYSNGTVVYTNNTGGTFNVNGFTTPFTGGTVNGLTANTISATTYQNLPIDLSVNSLLSSSLESGGNIVSINADPTKFNLTSFKYKIVNNADPSNPVITHYTFAGQSGITSTYYSTIYQATFLSIDSAGTIYQALTPLTATQRRTRVAFGTLVHRNQTSIESVYTTTTNPSTNLAATVEDFSNAIGSIIGGSVYSGNLTNVTKLDKSVGTSFRTGGNWGTDSTNPNIITSPALTNLQFEAEWRNGSGDFQHIDTDIVEFNKWDDNSGTLQTVSNNKWTIRLIYLSSVVGVTIVTYGQKVYDSLAQAESGISDTTVDNPITSSLSFRGWLFVRGGGTSLLNLNDTKFVTADKFGQRTVAGGSGGSSSTLQDVYNNSTTPEIQLDNTRGALTLKGWDGGQENNLEIMSSGGTLTAVIKADGGFSGTSFIKSGAPANTLMGADGITYSAGTNIAISGNVISATGGGGTTLKYYAEYSGAPALNAVVTASGSVAIGDSAEANSSESMVLGYQAGDNTTGATQTNFIGTSAGREASGAYSSNFIGNGAGLFAKSAFENNFIGYNAGYQASGSTRCNFIGYSAGKLLQDGAHNTIIGTNISLPNSTSGGLNIGGVIFGRGLYNSTAGVPIQTARPDGKIGINVALPTQALEVSGNTKISGTLTANTIVKSGGTPDQALMADGSVYSGLTDTIDYLTMNTNRLLFGY